MYLTITNIIRNFLGGGFQNQPQVKIHDDENHTYIRGESENRGPCPGLNALANQGYL